MSENNQSNPAVAVVGIVSGVSLVMVLFFAIFVREHMLVAGWIVTMLVLLGAIVAPLSGRRG